MSSRIRHLTFDCTDPYAQAVFWRAALGFVDDPDNPNAPGDPEAVIIDPKGLHPGLLFLPVPEPKATKNRLHLDVVPQGGATRDETVAALLDLGATLVADHRTPDSGWAVLADPEGNEFCVELAPAERNGYAAPVDTGERPMLHGQRQAGEREVLEAMLDWYREGIVNKVAGVSARHAAAAPLRSETSIAGLVKHLALVEDSWFARFAGVPEPEPWIGVDWDADPNWEFRTARDEPIEDLVASYRAACERSRALAAGHDLDEPGHSPGQQPFSLRYVYVHLIEETARHLGHLDILRELADGTTGD